MNIKIGEFIINNTIWYLINSYNHTYNMGDFNKDNKKLQRIIVGNILEYTVIYFLEKNNIKYKTDKFDPFNTDNGVDILINGNIPLHCKGSSILSMVGQIRNGKQIINELNRYGGYILIAYINILLVNRVINIINNYINNGGIFANDKIINIEDILYYIGNIDYGIITHNNWHNYINIYGLISVEDYFNNSYFVKYGDDIPGTKFKQYFEEGSYFLNKNYNNYIKLNDLLKNNN